VIGKQTFVEGEGVDDFILAAAGEQRLAVGREAEAVERLVEADPAYDSRMVLAQLDDDDFVFALAGVKDGGPLAVRVQCDIDGEVAEGEMCAGRPQRPLVGELDHAIGPNAWQDARRW